MRLTFKKLLALVALTLLSPALAHAHSAGPAMNGWHDGFTHPLSGWDHLLAMLAVGIWAARQRGRAMWLMPVTFLATMTVGAIAGTTGISLPGVELMVVGSVFVLGYFVVRRREMPLKASLALIGLFAFFHGFAHGAEMPGTASLVTFGLAFLTATALLHAAGLVGARAVILLMVCFAGTAAHAQETNATQKVTTTPPTDEGKLPDVMVYGRADSLLGIADSATVGTVGAEQLALRPTMRTGEILETVPGVIITQHAGGGKANQYFLRGFNLDHGTDFATFLDGMPLNLPSHGHGQGYSDMNIVIPEFVERINYQKGVYYAENGDFSSAGAAHLEFFKVLPESFVTAEGGMYGQARGVFGTSPKVGDGNLLIGGEYVHNDGPWERPDDFNKFNGIMTLSQGDNAQGYSLTARAYHGEWDSSDQVATSAVDDGLVPFFGSLDDTTGGHSQRYSVQAEWHCNTDTSATKVMAYGFYYDLDLFSNFTYFLTDTNRGDQFEQKDKRWVAGGAASHTLFGHLNDREMENTFGLQVRNDWIENGLFQTEAQQRVNKVDVLHDDFPLAATTRADDITETSVGVYFENKIQWAEKFRSEFGVRGDFFNFDVRSDNPANTDTRSAAIGSPKLTLVFGPWAKTEFYVQGGLGFHSNDGRGVTTRVDPVTGTTTNLDGEVVQQADPLVQTYGAEVGVRTLAVEGLQSTLSLWWLDVDSELVFVGDAGTTEASRPSRRYGVEWANYYNMTKTLTLDADFSFSHAEFRDDAPEGNHIPGSIESVVAAGLTYHTEGGFSASLRLRYFGPRPLIEDDSVRSEQTILLGLQVGYRINKHWSVSAEVFNLLNRRDHDIDYFYESRITPAADAVEQIHFHPVEPIQARVGVTVKW